LSATTAVVLGALQLLVAKLPHVPVGVPKLAKLTLDTRYELGQVRVSTVTLSASVPHTE
jgi:hypothetical protein